MKHLYLSLIIISCLVSCQSQTQEEATAPPATAPDTATTAAPVPQPSPPDTLYQIIPGQRIGKVYVGQTTEQVIKLLGQPDSGDAAMGKALSFWLSKSAQEPRHYLAIYFTRSTANSPQMLARQIRVNSPRFTTPEDTLRTGSPLKKIRKQHPQLRPIGFYTHPQQQYQVYIYDAPEAGIAFEVRTTDSTCTAITVHQKGEEMTNTYLPLHPDITWLNQQQPQ